MNNNSLIIVGGIIFSIGGIITIYMDRYFINNILPKRSLKEQSQYYRNEKELSEMGAFNVPLKDGKLISKCNSRESFYKFIVVLGIVAIILGIIPTK